MTEPARENYSGIVGKDGKPWESWQISPPPEDSPGVGKWVYEKYQILRKHRDKLGLIELWTHNSELLRNRIFKTKSKYVQVTANIFFKVHNSFKCNLTDNKPRASIMPNGDTSDDIADGWQACYDQWWDETKQQQCLQESVGNSELYGFQVDEMRFNPDLGAGVGEIETHRCNTYGVLLWPGHMDIQTQPGMCDYEAMELGEIYDIWPEAKGKVKADPEYSDLLGEGRAFVRGNRSRNLRPLGSAPNYVVPGEEGLGAEVRTVGIQRALVIKFWVKDYSMHWVDPRTGEPCKKDQQFLEPRIDPMTEQPMVDELGQPVMGPVVNHQTGEPIVPEEWSKYPGYLRCIIIANKGEFVLDDLPNPSINPELPRSITSQCYLWDKFPFVKRLSHSDDISEYGLCIFEQIEPLVMEICKKLTQYGNHLEKTCRNPLILPQGCGVRRDETNNLPARIWEPVAGLAQQIRFLEVPQAPNDIISYINLCIELIDMITGITDVSEGRRPTGITAGNAIGALQEKAQVVFREKIRNNDTYLEEHGRMFISLGQNWYTQERKLRYEGKGEEQMIDFKGTDFQGDISFHVEAGSTLPRNRAVRQQQIIELAQARPNFPLKVLLKELAIPNHDEVAAQMEAGPLGMLLNKLKVSGLFDDATLKAAQQIAQMPDKEFKHAFPQAGNPFSGKV